MTSERPDDDSLDEFSARGELDAVFGYGHLNPERAGCPSQEALALLARRRLPVHNPGCDHVTWAQGAISRWRSCAGGMASGVRHFLHAVRRQVLPIYLTSNYQPV